MIDRESFVWHWVNREGLYLKHKDLTADQILKRCGLEAVPGDNGWSVRKTDQVKARARHAFQV